jgi:hypothetical protein
MPGQRSRARLRSGFLAVVLGLLAVPALADADGDGAYEPNDTQGTAFGPLVNGQTLTAGLESDGDVDLYRFYVSRPSSVRVHLQNNFNSDASICGYVLLIYEPGDGSEIHQQSFTSNECDRSETDGDLFKSLPAGRYYLRVAVPAAYGIDIAHQGTYTLTALNGFSTRATIQLGCNARRATAKRTQQDVTRAAAALRRARRRGTGVSAAKRKLAKAKRAHTTSARAAKAYCAIL